VKAWHPSSGFAITKGDSFLTYVELIRVVLHDKRTFTA